MQLKSINMQALRLTVCITTAGSAVSCTLSVVQQSLPGITELAPTAVVVKSSAARWVVVSGASLCSYIVYT